MIDRALALREVSLYQVKTEYEQAYTHTQAIEITLLNKDFAELKKFALQGCEWRALEAFKTILQVAI